MKRILFVLLLCLSVLLCACSDASQPGSPETEPFVNELFYDLSKSDGVLDLVMFRVGRADAILLSAGDSTVLIGTGEAGDTDADKILAYLKTQNITRLDAVIVADHTNDSIGGFPAVAAGVAVGKVYLPAYNATGHRLTKFLRSVTAAGAEPILVSADTELSFGDCTVRLIPAENPQNYSSEKDMSLTVLLRHGDSTVLLPPEFGEARYGELYKSVPDPVTLLRLPDHGAFTDSLGGLLERYRPRAVLISDSSLNSAPYETLSMLSEKNIPYYRTKDAYICIRSDGKTLSYSQK